MSKRQLKTSRATRRVHPNWLPLLSFLAITTVIVVEGRIAARAEQNVLRAEVDDAAQQIRLRIESWVDARVAVIHHLTDEWAMSYVGRPEHFRAEVLRFMQLYPGFQAINFVDAGWVIETVVPERGNEGALGFDLHAHPVEGVREAIRRAASTDQVARTPGIELLQEGLGFAFYRKACDEQGKTLGFVNGVFRFDDLLAACLGSSDALARYVIQMHEQTDDRVVYEHGAKGVWPVGLPSANIVIRVVDRNWRMRVGLSPQAMAQLTSSSDEVFVALGVLLALMVALLLRSQGLRRAELERSEERLDLALRGGDLGTWDWDLRTNMVTVNERWVSLTRCRAPGNVLTLDDWKALIHPDDRAEMERRLGAHLEGVVLAFEGEHRLRRGNDEYIWVLSRGRVIEEGADRKPRRVCGTTLDITDRIRAEAEKADLERRLGQSQKMEAVGQLAGGVAHDFNNILTAILGNVELSLEEVQGEPGVAASVSRGLNEIKNSAERAARLTRQLLTFSRRQVSQPRPLDLNALLQDLRRMFSHLLSENIELVVKTDPRLHAIRADASQIEQVVMNLVLNAGDAMPSGGTLRVETANVTLDAAYRAAHAEAHEGTNVVLMVRDTGCGMDAETMERAFEPFFTTKPFGQGTGLGLATVYGAVTQAGGHLTVCSEVGQGTTFRVYFPAVEAPLPSPASVGDDSTRGGAECILVCEDDVAVRELTVALLRGAGYEVHAAEDGKSALKRAASIARPIDALVTDVVMPGLNGKELAQAMAKQYGVKRVLFVSGYTAAVIAQHGILDAGVEFLPKPFSRRALLKRVREVLDQPLSAAPPSKAS